MFTQQELLRYSRQILLPELKLEGQQKLKSGSAYFGKGELSGLKLEEPDKISNAFFRKGRA